MHQVNIHEAKTQLSKLIQEALRGEEVVIAKNNRPVVKIVSISDTKTKRTLGIAKGIMTMSDDFDEPLEEFNPYMP